MAKTPVKTPPKISLESTGLPGSIRTPRILCAPITSVPGSQVIQLEPARYVNDGPPLCIERIQALVVTTDPSIAARIFLRITVGKFNVFATFIPVMAVFDQPGVVSGIVTGVWYLKKPFVLPTGASMTVAVQNASTTAVSATVAFTGYVESQPAPVQAYHFPACIHDQLIANAATINNFKDEALKNDGAFPFHATHLALFQVDTTSYTPSAAVLQTKARITSTKSEIMLAQRLELETMVTADYNNFAGSVFAFNPTPLPGDFVLGPNEGFSCEYENASGSQVRADFSVLGYKSVPAEHFARAVNEGT